MTNQFAKDVLEGLQASPKKLPSKYFYDSTGDKLFQQIMKLDEYYLTRTEFDILNTHKEQLLKIFKEDTGRFNLVEFGAGDGYKTKILLNHFLSQEADFNYVPIDISANVLQQLESSLNKELPDLQVSSICNDYFKALDELKNGAARNVVLFLGSNIGNFTDNQAKNFLQCLYEGLGTGDLLLIGFDLKKDPQTILNAYNDQEGVTREFNLNLLHRINAELEGNFDIDKFQHYPIYNPLTGTTSSFLVSTEAQTVEIMDAAINFDAWEAIHMEISQKYSLRDVESLATGVGFSVVEHLFDDKCYFVNSVWQKV